MPKWWPWGRRPEPVAPPAPAARQEPVWQRLAAVTPTTGNIQPTAHLNGFTATLTTSQNPALTRPVQLLAVDEHHRLPVLDTGSAPPAEPPPTPVPAAQSRNWGPRLPSVQRAYVGSPVQRDSMPDQPAVAPLPVIDTSGEPEPERAMVQAADPDERRPLDAVTDDSTPAALPAPSPAPSEPFTMAPTAVERPAPAPPAIQRLTTDTPPLPAVVQRVAAPSPLAPDSSSTAPAVTSVVPAASGPEVFAARHTEVETTPLRHLHTVQRTDRVAPLIPTLAPLPVVTSRTPASRSEQDSPQLPPTTAIQRIADAAEAAADVADNVEQPAPAVNLAVVDTPGSEQPMGAETAAAATPSDIAQTPSHAPAAVQRLMPQQSPVPGPTASIPSTPPISLPSTPPTPSTPAPAVRVDSPAAPTPDLTTPAAEPAFTTDLPTVMPELPTVTDDYEPPVAQRSETVPFTAADTHPVPVPRVQPVSVFTEPQAPTVMRTVGDAPRGAPTPTAPVPVPTRPPTTPDPVRMADSPVAQRISLPVVTSAPTPTAAPPIRRPLPPTPPAVQRSAGSPRRLVVLPPIRGTDDSGSSPGVAAGRPDGAEVFSSPRPVGLQRMFEAGTQRVGQRVTAPSTSVESTPAPPPPDHWNSMETAQSTASAHEYDAATNTITFGSPGLPSVQRATEDPAPAAEPAAPIAAAPAMTSAPAASGSSAPAPAATDVDELVNRVYDALAARLRAELWLDRERAGALMDLGR